MIKLICKVTCRLKTAKHLAQVADNLGIFDLCASQ